MSKRGAGEGTIRKRPDGRWEWRFTDGFDPATGKQRQRSIYGKTQGELLKKKKAIQDEIDKRGGVINPSSITLESWLNEWLEVYCQSLKPRTLETYQSAISTRIVPGLGQAKLKNLKQKDVQAFVNTISAELSPKSVKNINGVLHKGLKKAVELELIKSNPADNIELPKLQKQEMHTIPEGSVKSFLSLFDGDFYQPLVSLALYTGLRQSELLGLTWNNVDMEHKSLTVRQQLTLVKGEGWRFTSPKHDKVRTIPLTAQALQVLHEQKERQAQWAADSHGLWNNADNLVFTNEIGGHCARSTLKTHWYKVLNNSEFSNIRFHDLRHSCATYMLRAGIDYRTLSEFLGHASIGFTMSQYVHVTAAMERDSADKLERFFDSL